MFTFIGSDVALLNCQITKVSKREDNFYVEIEDDFDNKFIVHTDSRKKFKNVVQLCKVINEGGSIITDDELIQKLS